MAFSQSFIRLSLLAVVAFVVVSNASPVEASFAPAEIKVNKFKLIKKMIKCGQINVLGAEGMGRLPFGRLGGGRDAGQQP